MGVSIYDASGGIHTLQAVPLLHQLYGDSRLQVDFQFLLQGSQHHQQADLSQNTVNTKFHSDGPDLAQHGPSVQQSARVAMVCLMHQLAVPLTSKDAAVSSQQQQVAAQHNAAAGSRYTVYFG